MNSYFDQKRQFKVKMPYWKNCLLLHKTLFDRLESCGLLWCFYQLFGLSFWWHPFTAEDPLVSKWCTAKFLQICSDEKTNSFTSWMTWGWVCFQQFFIFGWTFPLSKYVDPHTASRKHLFCCPASTPISHLVSKSSHNLMITQPQIQNPHKTAHKMFLSRLRPHLRE